MIDFTKYADESIKMVVEHGPRIILAVLVFIIGFFIINKITRIFSNVLSKKRIDVSLTTFIKSLLNITLKAILIISVADMIGITTTSFVAILGAAGLAIGLALQGTLANFAGGVLILLFKPYKVGDLIEAQGKVGHVKEIQVFVTILLTPDLKTVIIPNGAISNGNITNFTTEGKIRVDLIVGISYDSDIKKAKEIILETMANNPLVLKDPAPFVGVNELADSSINLAVRPHATPEQYWDVYFGVQEDAKIALDKAGIKIPFPQMDVHMSNKI